MIFRSRVKMLLKLTKKSALNFSLGAMAFANVSLGAEAHVHGIADLKAIPDGEKLRVEFTAPAEMWYDGLEHAPKTPAQSDLVDKVNKSVEGLVGTLFFLSGKELSCLADMKEFAGLSPAAKDGDTKKPKGKLDTKPSVKEKDHHHEDHKSNKEKSAKAHSKEEDHDHHEGHSDVRLVFDIECNQELKRPLTITTGFFKEFKRLKELRFTLIDSSGKTPPQTLKADFSNQAI